MQQLTGFENVISFLLKELRSIANVYFVLRAFCEPSIINFDDISSARKLRRRINRIATRCSRISCPESIKTILKSPWKSECWIPNLHTIINDQNYTGPEFDWIGKIYQFARDEFENVTMKALPSMFRQHIKKQYQGDVLKEIYVLRFGLQEKVTLRSCDEWIRTEIEENDYVAGSKWSIVSNLMQNRNFKPIWPDVVKTIRVIRAIFNPFRRNDRLGSEPTDDVLEQAVLDHVRRHQSRSIDTGDDKLNDWLDTDSLKIPQELEFHNVLEHLKQEFYPRILQEEQFRRVIDNMFVMKQLIRLVHNKLCYCLLPTHDQKPCWDPDTRTLEFCGKSVRYARHPAKNQTTILNAFQKEDWPKRIVDPLLVTYNFDPKIRLRETINRLNYKVKRNSSATCNESGGHGRQLAGSQVGFEGFGDGFRWVQAAKFQRAIDAHQDSL